jgi:FkbH-like protein
MAARALPREGHRNPALDRLSWQPVLFAFEPRRRDLATLAPSWPVRRIKCRVHRNHGFELIGTMIEPYLNFAGLSAAFEYSDYDDALSIRLDGEADLEIVWLDMAHYAEAKDVTGWLNERLAFLADQSDAPVLAVLLGDTDVPIVEAIPNVYVTDLKDIRSFLGPRFLDLRAAGHSGTRLSNAASLHVARLMGSWWIPALFQLPVRAIVLDLDNTLYEGVLGEDGAEGVRLTPGHGALQSHLKALRARGVFLALASRNEPEDVRRLFETRRDFPLRWDDFSHHAIGWGEKADAIVDAARALRIGTDAILFIDDNPGELLAVTTRLPEVNLLRAEPGGQETVDALAFAPGLFKWRRTQNDTLRVVDLNQAAKRKAARGAIVSRQDYFRSLGVELGFSIDQSAHLARAAELSAKTNQFNLALGRFSEKTAQTYLDDADKALVTISLSDRLSDSGLVAAIFARRDGKELVVDELCVSCRALGRDIETVMILSACGAVAEKLGTQSLAFSVAVGPRNDPARNWLKSIWGQTSSSESGLVRLPGIPDFEADGVTILWKATKGHLA